MLDSNESGVAVAELPMHRVAALLAVIDRTRVPDVPARLIAATAQVDGCPRPQPSFPQRRVADRIGKKRNRANREAPEDAKGDG
ncbi:MAG: hypothetical protein AVDCRST_MAG37-1955 [uncultured Rubrobacteraceae bacterium]|uniref:Uncharacterized protein n=1 Tax=uncultured Rubrobacteraceae bacterium TaxID=349277 RepID=A0A6J4QLN2_9ACTN|nr:MAG: hypothetical protein AVDCRST_MAG37-1955 [uncultured Rubrobacteraceae bacterium]